MGIKELLLKQGWAGRTISRTETIDHLNPIIRTMTVAMHHWAAAESALDGDAARAVSGALKTLRMDIGKMCETVFSCGGVAYNGTDLEPGSFTLGAEPWKTLADQEAALAAFLKPQMEVEHHMRTRAILAAVAANHEERVKLIRSLA
jgi:hypothetical protein